MHHSKPPCRAPAQALLLSVWHLCPSPGPQPCLASSFLSPCIRLGNAESKAAHAAAWLGKAACVSHSLCAAALLGKATSELCLLEKEEHFKSLIPLSWLRLLAGVSRCACVTFHPECWPSMTLCCQLSQVSWSLVFFLRPQLLESCDHISLSASVENKQ